MKGENYILRYFQYLCVLKLFILVANSDLLITFIIEVSTESQSKINNNKGCSFCLFKFTSLNSIFGLLDWWIPELKPQIKLPTCRKIDQFAKKQISMN